MNDLLHAHTPRTAGAGRSPGRGRLVARAAAGVLTASLALTACGAQAGGAGGDGRTSHGSGRESGQTSGSTWAEGITPEWMSRQMDLPVPATAQSPKAAYEITSRFDTGLLTFTLTRSEAEAYLKENPPKGRWLEPTSAATDTKPHDFAHLGLPEPETFKAGMRYGYVCPSTNASKPPETPADTYDTTDERCVRLYAHAYSPTRTRIYLRAHYEPGISPLPVPPSSSTPH
ncbi:hypothetical protein [Streptomyces sp. NPDC053431]|uniref:hypothetical protein n=1 Tax=Streptomyces sp. NPDC053431 TaxID=3365703 RepID=UPI0037D75CE9